MLPIARHHAHYVFAVIQSGLTTLVASGIASLPARSEGRFLAAWLPAWIVAWALMIPLVLVAAPLLRRLALALTRPESGSAIGSAIGPNRVPKASKPLHPTPFDAS